MHTSGSWPSGESQERLRLVLRAMRAGVWEWDVRSGRQIWSSEIDDFLGRQKATEPLGVPEFIAQFVHPDDRRRVESAYANLASGREKSGSIDIEYRIIRSDGTTVWVSCIAHLQQDESGRPLRVFGIKRDISARKQVEQAHEKTARFIHKITTVAPYYIFVFDLDEKRFVYGNRSLRELLGYERKDDENDSTFADEISHPQDRERSIAYRHSLRDLDDDAVTQIEYRFRRADDTWGWYLARHTVFARSDAGCVRQVVGTMTDITDLKRTESELRELNAELERRVETRTADLSAANRELETFAYSVSHDLRAPVRAIQGFGTRLLEEYGGSLDTEGRRYLGCINGAVLRMGELIDALLKLSRVTRGELAIEEVNMSALAWDVVTDLTRSEPLRKVAVVIGEGLIAKGDSALLRIALENLLGNAWKFTSRREQARIEFGAECSHGLSFFVRDDGVGFDMKHAARLFTPFHRLHTAAEFSGTGIGLATVQRIVERHGGRIWAESTPGFGATFHFTLRSGQ